MEGGRERMDGGRVKGKREDGGREGERKGRGWRGEERVTGMEREKREREVSRRMWDDRGRRKQKDIHCRDDADMPVARRPSRAPVARLFVVSSPD